MCVALPLSTFLPRTVDQVNRAFCELLQRPRRRTLPAPLKINLFFINKAAVQPVKMPFDLIVSWNISNGSLLVGVPPISLLTPAII